MTIKNINEASLHDVGDKDWANDVDGKPDRVVDLSGLGHGKNAKVHLYNNKGPGKKYTLAHTVGSTATTDIYAYKGKAPSDDEIRQHWDNRSVDESAASDTLKPASMVGTSKTAAMADVASIMQGMGSETINKFMEMMKQYTGGQAGDGVPDGAAAANAKTIEAKPSFAAAQEDLEVLFGGNEELTEDFKKSASNLFEAAVSLRVSQETARIEEEFEAKLEEEANAILENLVDQTDEYLDYVVNEWYEENEVAIDNSVRTEIAEGFMLELRDLFNSYFIDVAEDKVDMVEELTAQIEQLRSDMNEILEQNAQLETELSVAAVEKIFNNVAEGLTDTQKEKLMGLTENLSYEDFEDFENKLKDIKESYFDKKTDDSSKKLAESITMFEETENLDEEVGEKLDPRMSAYVSAVKKSLK